MIERNGHTLEFIGAEDTDECFTHDEIGTINVTRANLWADLNLEVFLAEYTKENCLKMLDGRDLDKRRLDELWRDLMNGTPIKPILVTSLPLPSDEVLILDGHHRMALFASVGLYRTPARHLPWHETERFRVSVKLDGEILMPKDILKATWGIYSRRQV